MGTDIHAVFQAKRNGVWGDIVSPYDEERWYFLFAWLANVRNGRGFAGIKTGEPIKPISEPRGLPEDFATVEGSMHRIPSNAHRGRRADRYKDEDANPEDPDYLLMDMGDHSFSWLLASEILDAPEQPYAKCGVLDLDVYKAWPAGTEPDEWRVDVSGPGVQIFEAQILTASGTKPEIPEGFSHVRVAWTGNVLEVLSEFRDMVRKLQEEHGEVRMVFGFDS